MSVCLTAYMSVCLTENMSVCLTELTLADLYHSYDHMTVWPHYVMTDDPSGCKKKAAQSNERWVACSVVLALDLELLPQHKKGAYISAQEQCLSQLWTVIDSKVNPHLMRSWCVQLFALVISWSRQVLLLDPVPSMHHSGSFIHSFWSDSACLSVSVCLREKSCCTTWRVPVRYRGTSNRLLGILQNSCNERGYQMIN